MSHALLSPSAAHRWIVCPGSVKLSEGIENASSEHAEEGALAHSAAADLLNGLSWPNNLPDGMYAPVQTYVDTVKYMSDGALGTWVEQKIDLSSVYGVNDQFGTADYIAVTDTELQVHDLKYGKGVEISATDNWQLIIYALGALDFVESFTDVQRIRCVIHQPRLGIVSEEIYTVDQIKEYLHLIRKSAKSVIEQVNGFSEIECNPGEKQCKWCLVTGSCEALKNYAINMIASNFNDLEKRDLKTEIKIATETVKEGGNTEIAKLLGVIDLISGWIKAVEARAHSLLLAGEYVPGYKLVTGRAGSRKWVSEEEATEVMKSMRLKHEEMYSHSLISPTKAEELLKESSRKWNRLTPLITQPEGKPTIAPESDKRPALNMGNIKEQFEDISQLLNI